MKLLGADNLADKFLISSAVVVVWHCACEGSKQRFVPTELATGDNEIKQHRNFSETHFPGVAPCRFCLVGHDGGAVWDCRPNVCCPAGGCCQVAARRIAAFAAVL